MTLGDADAASALIAQWYVEHRQIGGKPDEAIETILRDLSPGQHAGECHSSRQARDVSALITDSTLDAE